MSSVFLDRYDNALMTRVFPADDLARLVKDSVSWYERKADKAIKEAAKTREEVRSETLNQYEEENRQLKAKLGRAVAILGNDVELERFNNFRREHMKCSVVGELPYVKQFATGIGTCTTVCCQGCGAERDITDTNDW